MEIRREWAMPNSRTFCVPPIKNFVEKYVNGTVIDPFANEAKYGTITNDLNPDYDTCYHLDALTFLQMQSDESADVVLYDPPYSPRQVSESYRGVGMLVTTETTQAAYWAKQKDEIARIVKPCGYVLSFGWNSNGIGKSRGFEQVELLIVAHGGWHNDTLCLAERKSPIMQYRLSDFK